MKIVKQLISAKINATDILVKTNAADFVISFFTDEIIRIRVSFDGHFNDFSYIVNTDAQKKLRKDLEVYEDDNLITLTGTVLSVEIVKSPFMISIKDIKGNVLHRDVKYGAYMCDTNNRRSHRQELTGADHYYGFGERTGALDKKERREVDIEGDYVGFNVPNEFVVGFGLDFNQLYRNLPYVGVLKEECYKE